MESGQATHRAFTLAEQETSLSYRELLAIQYVIRAFEPLLMGCNVKLLTGGHMAAKIALVGSMKLAFHQLAISNDLAKCVTQATTQASTCRQSTARLSQN